MSSLPVLAEIGLLVAASWIFFESRGFKLAEALCAGVVASMMALSCLLQVVFLFGRPGLALVGEVALAALAGVYLVSSRRLVARTWRRIGRFARCHRALSPAIGIAWLYLALAALLIPPDNNDSLRCHLARVLLFHQDETLFLDVTGPSQAHRSVYPPGSDILNYLFLRFHEDYGIGVFCFLSYLAIVAGVYGLARRHASARASLCAATVVAGLPGLVYQATSTKNDITMAAVGVLCFVLGHRLLDRLNALDLVLLGLSLLFGVSVKTSFLAFVLPFLAVFGALVLRRHGPASVCAIFKHKAALLAVPPAIVLSDVWFFAHNYRQTGGLFGPPDFTEGIRNHDGLWGAVANLVRYAHEVPDLLKVGDRLADRMLGFQLSDGLQWLYDSLFQPLFRGAGASSPFRIDWSMHEAKSWFGPLSFLIILPAALLAARRGPTALRALSLTLLGYVLIFALQIQWMQWNARFFTICFASAGAAAGWLLDRWSDSRLIMRTVLATSVGCLVYACVFNQTKPIFPLVADVERFSDALISDNVWTRTRWGRDRYHAYGNTEGLESFSRAVPNGARVGIVSGHVSPFYHYMMRRPDLRFQPLPHRLETGGSFDAGALAGLDYLLCIGLDACRSIAVPGLTARRCFTVDSRWNDFCFFEVAEHETT